jgi:hypothetical protein
VEKAISATVRATIPVAAVHILTVCRNHVPWAIIAACSFVSGLTLLVLRYRLAAENKRRDAEKRDDTYDDIYLTQVQPDGTSIEKKVDRVRIALPMDVEMSLTLN